MGVFDQIIQSLAKGEATDLHLSSGVPPTIRMQGRMIPLTDDPVSSDNLTQFLYEIMSPSQREQYERDWQVEFSVDRPDMPRFRINAFRQSHGPSAVLRLLKSATYSFKELGFPKNIEKLLNRDRGLIIITGPLGSGRSTTAASMIDYINSQQHKVIHTIESPIEYMHKNKQSIVRQHEIPTDFQSFNEGFQEILSTDPDVVFVGDMNNRQTLTLAINASLTGRVIIGTMQSETASKAVWKMVRIFPEDQQLKIRSLLAEALITVIAQDLLPRADGTGRMVVHEILINNDLTSKIIRQNRLHQLPAVTRTQGHAGMSNMEKAVKRLVRENMITPRVAVKKLLSLR